MVGVLASCCAVQTICRARHEESSGTAEAVLSAGVGRVRWLAAHAVVGFAGVVAVVVSAVVGAALGLASSRGDWSLMGDVLVSGVGQIAAASVFLVLTSLVFVLAPRLTVPLGWALVLLGTVVGLFGPLFGFPRWLVDLAPISLAPSVAADGAQVNGLWWLVLVVAAGAAASLSLMRRRELAPAG